MGWRMAQDLDSKEGLLRDLVAEWERLLESLKGLSDEHLQAPNVVGVWSLKDLLGHITSWEEEALQMVQEKLAGGEPNFYPYIVDERNAQQVERKRSIPLQEVHAAFHETHQRLMELTSQLPEDVFLEMTPVRLALEADCWGHYVEHRRQVDAWRTS
ncbi:MAG: ClbS/DfsB family four-helix bundle protein [Dehalococcoidia bacterium]|nr:ClbS/DfsB family four-helix bundle protein [Dehalococcoidia bacterium]